MKIPFALSPLILALCWPLSASALDLSEAEQLWQAKDYPSLLAIESNADAELYGYRLKALVQLEREDDAEEELAPFLLKHAGEAKAQFLAGNIYIMLAQRASIFSAPGLAGKGLAAYEQAHVLAPEDLEVMQSLFGFYLHAPGMVGGDRDKALALAKQIQARSAHEGQLAMLQYLQVQEDKAGFERQMAEAKRAFPQDLQLALLEAHFHEEDHGRALAILSEALTWPQQDPEQHTDLRYQLAKHAVKGKLNTEQAIQALAPLLQQIPERYQGWVQLRRAQLAEQLGDKAGARDWLAKAQAEKREDGELKRELKALKKRLKA
ncbi:hypothetical protein JYB88_14145 [Shewanella cyperi]|uniref:Tetratricopeptide repeat protein n=1 Tax=Shewanella cyperi TaxID=2814292 RepID=A0A974XLA8_9GAMM|nr:hypothetical protein [Shewanella cyperi]QSX29338.1 hypothetical protein JYB88_14145 [Shewanella cyperi]